MCKRISHVNQVHSVNKPQKINVINSINQYKNKACSNKIISTGGAIGNIADLSQSEKREFPLSTCHQLIYLQPEGAIHWTHRET